MQDGVLAGGVPQWQHRVTVAGVPRPIESMSWAGEIASDLPEEVTLGSGIVPRTGTIEWAPLSAVETVPVSPMARRASWPPSPGDRVEIYVGDEDTSWRVFTGKIDSTSGDSDSLSSSIIDMTDNLDRDITIPPVAWKIPTGYGREYTGSYVQPWYAAFRCLREAGWGIGQPTYGATTPATMLIAADLQGTFSPIWGELVYASDPVLSWGEGFTYLSSGIVSYAPLRDLPISAGRGVRMWLQFADATAVGNVILDNGEYLRVSIVRNTVTGRANLTVKLAEGGTSGTGGTVLYEDTISIQVDSGDDAQWVEVFLANNSNTLYYSHPMTSIPNWTTNGDSYSTIDLGATISSGARIDRVSLSGSVSAVRAQVITRTEWNTISPHTVGLRIRAWGLGLVRYQSVSRTLENVNARSVLADISASTLTSLWVDEVGVLQWAPVNRLYAQEPVLTVTTAQDVFELGWTESARATRHRTFVSYQATSETFQRRDTVLLYQPSNVSTVKVDEVQEDFIKVPDDEEWFGVNDTLTQALDDLDSFNRGIGSFFGASRMADSETSVWSSGIAHSIQSLGMRTWLLRQRAGTTDKELMAPDDYTTVWKRRREQPLPIMRGMGRVVFTDTQVRGSSTGPDWASDYTHELGWWGKEEDAQRLADWLSARLASPVVALTDLEIAYDPRIQLGDVIKVDSTAFMGFRMNCLVIGKSESHGPDGARLVLSVRVLQTTTTHTTYEDFEAAYTGRAYSALESAWAGSTYASLEYDPTGEP